MGVIPEKTDYKNCSKEFSTRFAEALSTRKICDRVAFVAASDKSHFDRYGFVKDNKKISVVYDNKARILSVTAFDELMPEINKLYVSLAAADVKSQKTADVVIKSEQKANAIKASAKNGASRSEFDKSKKAVKPSAAKSDSKQKAAGSDEKKSVSIKNQTAVKQIIKSEIQKKSEDNQPDQEGCGDISLKKYTEQRFIGIINKLKKDGKRYKLSDAVITDKGKPTELKVFTITAGNQKLKLRFMPKKQVVQLQGKHSALFTELQLLLSEETDYRAAVDAHIEQSREDKKASEVERQLKKLIPNAFGFLSQQSKIDFTIGVIELINSKEKHYDYSMLLLPPFRGLERLIFDLQRAQNVIVKMIGQAYEKQDGQYVLKASYRRKINSVVYAEVMADLYREYFETRNFYAHSDSSEKSETRMITQKEQASAIFEKMLAKVDYNCKKLSEIGFSVQ